MKFTTHLGQHSQAIRLFDPRPYVQNSKSKTGFSPSMIPCFKRFIPGSGLGQGLQVTFRSTARYTDFNFELFPLHSPLLGESLLVSFPPLIDMLKFSGYPYLIRGQRRGASANIKTELPYLLGTTNPYPNTVHMEPFSTSVFKVLI